jgi:hypothetical protein
MSRRYMSLSKFFCPSVVVGLNQVRHLSSRDEYGEGLCLERFISSEELKLFFLLSVSHSFEGFRGDCINAFEDTRKVVGIGETDGLSHFLDEHVAIPQ